MALSLHFFEGLSLVGLERGLGVCIFWSSLKNGHVYLRLRAIWLGTHWHENWVCDLTFPFTDLILTFMFYVFSPELQHISSYFTTCKCNIYHQKRNKKPQIRASSASVIWILFEQNLEFAMTVTV